MTDEENDNNDIDDNAFEEEFEIEEDILTPEDEIEEALEASAPDEEQPKKPAKRKSLMLPMLIGLGLVGFIGWKIYGIIQDDIPELDAPSLGAGEMPSVPKAPQAPSQPTEGEPTAASQPLAEAEMALDEIATGPDGSAADVAIEQPMPVEPAESTLPKVKPADVQKLEEQMAQQSKAVQSQVKSMQQELANVLENANTTAQAVKNLQSDVVELTNTIKSIAQDVNNMQKSQQKLLSKPKPSEQPSARQDRTAPREHHATPPPPPPTGNYAVHAIIPGRAWLRTNDGKTISVAEGDTVPGLGKVLKVDAYNGVVVMSSGGVIR